MPVAEHLFKQLKVGFKHQMSKKITLEDIDDFSRLSGDSHPLHMDLDYAHEQDFENRICHGMLLSSFAVGMAAMYLPGRRGVLLSQSSHYHLPVFPGDTILIEGEIIKIDERFSLLNIELTLTNQEDLVVSSGQVEIMVR